MIDGVSPEPAPHGPCRRRPAAARSHRRVGLDGVRRPPKSSSPQPWKVGEWSDPRGGVLIRRRRAGRGSSTRRRGLQSGWRETFWSSSDHCSFTNLLKYQNITFNGSNF
jgi:hypothetical protein